MKSISHAKSAKASMQERFSKFSFLKFHIPHFAFPNQISPWRPLPEPSPTPHAKSAKASMQERFSKFSFLKFHIPHFAFPNQITPFRPWRPLRESSAFSLTEVVIAMGVAAVAFTSIIALFPLGLNMSKESYEATQAALIAQTIFCDLRDQLTGSTPLKGRLVQIKEVNSPLDLTSYQNVNTTLTRDTPQILYVAYAEKQDRADKIGSGPIIRPSNSVSQTEYQNGLQGALFIAKISVSATFRMDSASSGNPQRVDIAIETPGSLPTQKRTQFLFSGGVAQ